MTASEPRRPDDDAPETQQLLGLLPFPGPPVKDPAEYLAGLPPRVSRRTAALIRRIGGLGTDEKQAARDFITAVAAAARSCPPVSEAPFGDLAGYALLGELHLLLIEIANEAKATATNNPIPAQERGTNNG